MATLDVEKLIAEINQQIKQPQKIHPDDPILISVILHNQILEAQIDALQQKMDETINKFTVISEQQVKKAEALTAKMMIDNGDAITKQLDTAVKLTEERFTAQIKQTSRLAWVCTVLIAIAACIYIGTWLGNVIFDVTHPQKSAQQQNTKPNRPKQSRN